MDKLKNYSVIAVSSKWFWIVSFVLLSLFWSSVSANAKYYPLECSQNYSGYCNEGSDCYTEFGDDGLNYLDFCFNVPNVPNEFMDETTGLEVVVDRLEMILSGNIFLYNVVGFWLPFSVILNFCLVVLFGLLIKFGYFRKQ